jgi:hypothetical protein
VVTCAEHTLRSSEMAGLSWEDVLWMDQEGVVLVVLAVVLVITSKIRRYIFYSEINIITFKQLLNCRWL